MLIAVFACTPMFKAGSLDMLIDTKFRDKIAEDNAYPFVFSRGAVIRSEGVTYDSVVDKTEEYYATWENYTGLDSIEHETIIWAAGGNISHKYGTDKNWLNIATVQGMKEHVTTLCGTAFGEECEIVPGTYPCYVSQKTMDAMNFVVGDIITYDTLGSEKDNKLKFQLIGIITEKDEDSYFWNKRIDELNKCLIVEEDVLSTIMSERELGDINYEAIDLISYSQVNSENIDDVEYYIKEFAEKDEGFIENVSGLIEDYKSDRKFINIICWVLELPIIMLLLAFIYMIVNQILSMETGEISMLTSRGFKRKQVMKLYFQQSMVLSIIGLIIGVPLGYVFCKVAASTNGFLEFSMKDVSSYSFRVSMILYGVVGAVIAMIFITAPVFFYAKDSIIERRSKKNNKTKKRFISRLCTNGILLALSVYLLINYYKQRDMLSMQVMTGERLDPIVFLNLTLFLFACGLFGLMLMQGLARLVYWIGRKRWKPHTYVSLLQIIRGDSRSQFIAVFLILTVAMGIVNANVAGTINTNNEERIEYDIGADMVIKEQWVPKKYNDAQTRTVIRYYVEPNFQRFSEALEGKVNNMTRVVNEKGLRVASGGTTLENCTMLAINTKEFGETARLKPNLNDTHWYHYLNELSKTNYGVLVSRELADMLKLEVGDDMKFVRTSDEQGAYNEITEIATVCGIYDALPSCAKYVYNYDSNGELVEENDYSFVINYTHSVRTFGDIPYEIWMDLKDGVTYDDVVNAVSDNDIKLLYSKGINNSITELKNSAMIQITNGLFTLSFVISLILCMIGYLIYWITAMKQRELRLGIYRAMGISFKEVNKMLMLEQILSSLFAGILGGGIGMLASLLHTKVLAVVYLPEKHSIALHTVIDAMNLARFIVLLFVMVFICMMVMRCQIRKLNMVQAIKMGED